MDLTKAGRGGLACTRAMEGAKRGPQERVLPSPANLPRPASTSAAGLLGWPA